MEVVHIRREDRQIAQYVRLGTLVICSGRRYRSARWDTTQCSGRATVPPVVRATTVPTALKPSKFLVVVEPTRVLALRHVHPVLQDINARLL